MLKQLLLLHSAIVEWPFKMLLHMMPCYGTKWGFAQKPADRHRDENPRTRSPACVRTRWTKTNTDRGLPRIIVNHRKPSGANCTLLPARGRSCHSAREIQLMHYTTLLSMAQTRLRVQPRETKPQLTMPNLRIRLFVLKPAHRFV